MKIYKSFETEKGELEFYAIKDYDVVIYAECYLNKTHLGRIFFEWGNEWDKILSGRNPIEEGWENGNGKTLTYDGWDD